MFRRSLTVIVLALCVLFSACALADVELNEVNFADAAFLDYMKTGFDTDADGVLDDGEIAVIEKIDVEDLGIASLSGIEYFTSLKELNCGKNALTKIDLSKNTALATLKCSDNDLTELDLTANTLLEVCECAGNCLETLDLSANTKLTTFMGDGQKLEKEVTETETGYSVTLSKNIDIKEISAGAVYDAATGIVAFTDKAGSIEYTAQTGCGAYGLKVTVILDYPSQNIDVESVTIKCENKRMYLKKNQKISIQLEYEFSPEDADIVKVKWKSENKKVASIDANGVVTALKAGKSNVFVTVTDASGNKAKAKITINVKKVVATSITADKRSDVLAVGEEYAPIITVKPSENLFDETLKWTSSNKKVAKVNAKGVIRARSKGTAVITVKTSNGKKATIKIKVIK